jgi:glutathione S-transferase
VIAGGLDPARAADYVSPCRAARGEPAAPPHPQRSDRSTATDPIHSNGEDAMKLYFSPGACSLSPHIVLKELGLPFEAEKVDLATKKTATGADFAAISPLGYVPALKLDGGEVLTEGPAIVQYLADRKPEAGLAPAAGTLARYRLQEWLNLITSELHKAIGSLFNAKLPEEAKAMTKERLQSRFAHLEKHFAKNDYLMGSAFTVADAYAFTVLGWTRMLKIPLDAYPNVKAFMARVAARPKVQEAMKAEGLIK